MEENETKGIDQYMKSFEETKRKTKKDCYGKHYFEKYAALTLSHIFSIPEQEILLSDCPDLRISSLQMGIEVTQAIKSNLVFYKRKQDLYETRMMNPFDQIERLNEEDDLDCYFKKIAEAIQRKIEKSVHYQSYEHNGLYIFTHCDHLSLPALVSFFQEQSFDQSFYHEIYLNAMNELYRYHMNEERWEQYHFYNSDLLLMNYAALRYEEEFDR